MDDFGRNRSDIGRTPGWSPAAGEGLGLGAPPPIEIKQFSGSSGAARGSLALLNLVPQQTVFVSLVAYNVAVNRARDARRDFGKH